MAVAEAVVAVVAVVVVEDPVEVVVVVVVVVVDFLAAFSVAVNRPVEVLVHHHHHHTVGRHIRNKPIIPVPEPIPTRTMDGILEEINTIQEMAITTIHLHLLRIGDRRTIVRPITVHHKMHSDHFIQLAVVIFICFYIRKNQRLLSYPDSIRPR